MPLAYLGLGELFVILFFGFVAVLGTFFVQTGDWGGTPLILLGLQVGLYSSVLIAINNLRDREEDAGTNKRTLAVRLGAGFARGEIAVFCFGPLLIWPFVFGWEMPSMLCLVALAGTASRITGKIFTTEPGPAYNKFLALGAVQLLLFAGLATYLFLWS